MSLNTSKLIALEQLREVVSKLKSDQKKVIHCHGVFDLLHLGHIRHLEDAKNQGDVLIVTITPDEFVNKGPGRPAFTDTLRAESLAALSCVDYVAVNNAANAVELLKYIAPNVYFKGIEYKEAADDVTGGITLEKQAVESVGGTLEFSDKLTFSSSALINQHLEVLPDEVTDFLGKFKQEHSEAEVLNYLEQASKLKVLIIGETIIDEYKYCQAIGKSSKEPVLVVKDLETEKFAGGVLAVANHVANFSEDVGLISFLGSYDTELDFIRKKLSEKVQTHFLARKDSPTIVKKRYIEQYFFSKLFEVYQINDAMLDPVDEDVLCSTLEKEIPNYDVVIVVDFGHSMLTPKATEIVCNRSKFLALNTQSNAGNLGYNTISKYPRADHISLAENEMRLEERDRQGDLRPMLKDVAEKLSAKTVVVTRGSKGSLCYSPKVGFSEVPALAGKVVDRVGAGDSFLAVTALCAVQNAPLDILGFIGNAVGAQAVATVGNRHAIAKIPLIRQIQTLLK